jgi:putative hydrolase of the HAD superfamily
MISQQALILDFGGVISRTMFETHALTERALSLKPGTLQWRGPFDPEHDSLWRDMQADRISEREYWMTRTREVGELLGERWDQMETFVKRARGADTEAIIRPEATAAVTAVRAAGCKLAILSNELDLFYGTEFRTHLPLMNNFDVVVDATHTGVLKPDPRAYQLCLQQLQLSAQQCVFVDDQLRNVLGAQRAGLRTVHFNVLRPADSYAEALALLGVEYDRHAPSAGPS